MKTKRKKINKVLIAKQRHCLVIALDVLESIANTESPKGAALKKEAQRALKWMLAVTE